MTNKPVRQRPKGLKDTLTDWNPQLSDTKINPDLENLPTAERVAEVMRQSAAEFDQFGVLREWLKFNLKLFVILAVPTFLLVPIAALMLSLIKTVLEILLTAIAAVVAIAVLYVLCLILIAVVRSTQNPNNKRRN
ncbi:MAG: hypothetical protein HRT89_24435 [Lentisphaeria bacterium]|nr:hypothetical protein [Lentisphaeria bacterium]NQZ71205.1 hypothetical protein [Lentisphaeria bacterium]